MTDVLPHDARSHRRILLRLDDGSLIGRAVDLGREAQPQTVIRLSVDQAAHIGRATDKEVVRLQTILDRLKATHGLPDAALEVRSLPPTKKARMDPITYSAPPAGGAWLSKCKEVLNKVLKHLSHNKDVFYNPVDPKLLPDYYKVVKEPLFLRDIDQRLSARTYQQPDDFLRDMKHHFANVLLYNPKGDPFRAIGEKAEEYFDHLWAATDLTNERTKRATAGLAAPKFDPERFDAALKSKPSRSQGAAGKRPKDGARSASHEVTSGKDEQGQLTLARIQEMGTYLSREDLPEEHSQHLVSLLPPAMVAGLESGELELDLDALDSETLLRIDAWLRTVPDAQAMLSPPSPARPQRSQSHARVDWDDDDDEDYEEDSETSED